MDMGDIGLPEIVIALVVIGVPYWAYCRFPLPKNPFERYALIALAAVILALLMWARMVPFRPVATSRLRVQSPINQSTLNKESIIKDRPIKDSARG